MYFLFILFVYVTIAKFVLKENTFCPVYGFENAFWFLCRDAGVEIGECNVPSQPMLEWLCLKLLGASSLSARTLERCTQAFMYPKCSHS